MSQKSSRKKNQSAGRRAIRLEAKRHTELWIYSFADMYMILVFFFIAMSAIYSLKAKNSEGGEPIPAVGRGIAAAEAFKSIYFDEASHYLDDNARNTLNDLLPLVKNNKKLIVEIEGYSDSQPVSRRVSYTSNLHLSNQRAVAVAEWFLEKGVRPSQLRTYAYGDGHRYSKLNEKVQSDRRVVVKWYMRH